jgi:hypothetical protein
VAHDRPDKTSPEVVGKILHLRHAKRAPGSHVHLGVEHVYIEPRTPQLNERPG